MSATSHLSTVFRAQSKQYGHTPPSDSVSEEIMTLEIWRFILLLIL